jgi:hypothetical protein
MGQAIMNGVIKSGFLDANHFMLTTETVIIKNRTKKFKSECLQ